MTAAEKAAVRVRKMVQLREGSFLGRLGRPSMRKAGLRSGALYFAAAAAAAEASGDVEAGVDVVVVVVVVVVEGVGPGAGAWERASRQSGVGLGSR